MRPLRPVAKLSILSAILIADLFFFLFLGFCYPETLGVILSWLPWNDSMEKAVLVLSGLVISIVASTAIVWLTLRDLIKLSK